MPPAALRLLLCASLALICATPTRAVVYISEFMASSLNTNIRDEDGTLQDWIELHNAGEEPVSLNGWYLTDDAANKRKWQFPVHSPAVLLPPNARIVVWASDKNRKASADRLHTNFKLDAGGEYLGLIRPDGMAVEHEYAPTYPPQATDVSYGVSGGRQWNVLIGPTLPAPGGDWRVRVPQSAADFTAMTGWNTDPAFNEGTAWVSKRTLVVNNVTKGIGYDSGGIGGVRAFLVNYNSSNPTGAVAFPSDLGSTNTGMTLTGMYNTGSFAGAPTLCARRTFSVADPAAIHQLRLNIHYDDGFIVYLNGNEVLRVNAPTSVAWNSAAPADREDDQMEGPETFNLGGAQQHLVAGTNVIAIHAFNEVKNSAQFLLTPSFEAFQDAAGEAGLAGYLSSPTPGTENTIASSSIGPDVSRTTQNPPQPPPTTSVPFTITSRVRPTLSPIQSVTLRYMRMYAGEQVLTMVDNGTNGDATAGDGIFTAQIPANEMGALQESHMIRWRIIATDTEGRVTNDPPFRDPMDNDQYYGVIAQTPNIQTGLPVLFWFSNTEGTGTGYNGHGHTFAQVASNNRLGKRNNSFYFKQAGEATGRFYDNVFANIHGQSTASFGKKAQNLNFNRDNRFIWRTGESGIPGFNLLSNYADKTKIRNSLAWETWNTLGYPSHWSQPVRVQQIIPSTFNAGVNGQFYGLWDMVEDGNRDFLRRWGLDDNGALYKLYHSLQDAAQTSSTNSNAGAEKKTREWESFSDLQTLVTMMDESRGVTLRRQCLYDNVDVPALIDFIAIHNLIHSHDYGHKNYYVYRDTNGTGEWKPIPWDQDLSFGHRWTSAQNYFDDDLQSAASIMLGGGGNRLMNIINTSGATELTQMYVRRLRTLADQFYGSPAAPSDYFANRIDALQDVLDPADAPAPTDAERDFQKWGFWLDGSGATISFTSPLAVHHRLRPSAVRLKSVNNTSIYPGENPYAPYGSTPNLHSSMNPFIPGRRAYLFNQIPGATPNLQGQVVPAAQPPNPTLIIENINFNPAGGQEGEFFVIRNNTGGAAIDLSGWKLTNAVNFTFPGGTVIPAPNLSTSDASQSFHVNQLVVAKNKKAFRSRIPANNNEPQANRYWLTVGGYSGQLSARGGVIELRNPQNAIVATSTYIGNPTPSQTFLRVTELHYAPPSPTAAELAALPGVQAADFEFVELVNTGPAALNLGNAAFDQGISFAFPPVFSLAAGERLVLAANRAAFELRYGNGTSIAGVYEGNFDNSGERVRLLDAIGEVVLDFTYNPAWYPPTRGGGYSLVTRIGETQFDQFGNPLSWAISGSPGGSPGVAEPDGMSQVYEGWLHGFFTPAEQNSPGISGPTADRDGDLDSNFYEYAFGTNPSVADGRRAPESLLVNVGGVEYPAVRFIRARKALDVVYVVEITGDLADPASWTPVETLVQAVNLGDGTERVTFRDSTPAGVTPRFFRVRALR